MGSQRRAFESMNENTPLLVHLHPTFDDLASGFAATLIHAPTLIFICLISRRRHRHRHYLKVLLRFILCVKLRHFLNNFGNTRSLFPLRSYPACPITCCLADRLRRNVRTIVQPLTTTSLPKFRKAKSQYPTYVFKGSQFREERLSFYVCHPSTDLACYWHLCAPEFKNIATQLNQSDFV